MRECAWHEVALTQRRGPAPQSTRLTISEETAVLAALGVGVVTVRRDDRSATISAPNALGDDVLTHPLSSFIGAVLARWTARSAFHAAAVELEGGAWVVLGAPGSGKSTTASLLHADGATVLADDLGVIEGMTVLAGPALGDLRQDAAAQLSRGHRLSAEVGRPRWREQFAPAPFETPLAGFIELDAVGPELHAEPVPPAERLGVLARHEALGLGPSAHRGFLDLLPLPMWRLTRPTAWDRSGATTALVRQIAQRP